MKRLMSSIAVTAILGLGAFTAAGAQGPARGRGVGPGPDGGPGRGAMMMLRGLELTESQREQIRAVRRAQAGAADARRAGELHRQLQAELLADTPDAGKIADLQRQIVEGQSARLERLIALQGQIAQVLTAEQRATLRERLAQAPNRGGRGRPRPSHAW